MEIKRLQAGNPATPENPKVHKYLCIQVCINKVEFYRTNNDVLIKKDLSIKHLNEEYKKADKIYSTKIKTYHDDMAKVHAKKLLNFMKSK